MLPLASHLLILIMLSSQNTVVTLSELLSVQKKKKSLLFLVKIDNIPFSEVYEMGTLFPLYN